MEVLLKRTVDHLGRLGEVVSVQRGYARNYLLPYGIAVLVTKANMEQLEKERANVMAEERVRIQDLKSMADKIAETSVTVEGRANEDGHLFGSVNVAQIAKAVREKGLQIEEKSIRLDHPIKEIGVFDVTVHLHQDVDATLKVWVVQSKPSS